MNLAKETGRKTVCILNPHPVFSHHFLSLLRHVKFHAHFAAHP